MQRTGVLLGLVYLCLKVVQGQLTCSLPDTALECVKCDGDSFSECENSALRDICSGPNPICLSASFTSSVTGLTTKSRLCIPDASICDKTDGTDFDCNQEQGSTVTTCKSCGFVANDICVPNPDGFPSPEATTTMVLPAIPVTECPPNHILTTVDFNNLDFIDPSIDGEPASREEAKQALRGSRKTLEMKKGQTFVLDFANPVVVWQVNFTVTGASKFLMSCFDEHGEMFFQIPGQTSFPAGLSMVFIHAPEGEIGTKRIVISFPEVVESGEFVISTLRALVCVEICGQNVNYGFDNSDNFLLVITGANGADQDKDILAGSEKQFGISKAASVIMTMSKPTDVVSLSMTTSNVDSVTVKMFSQGREERYSQTQPGGGSNDASNTDMVFGLSVGLIEAITKIEITVQTTSLGYRMFDLLPVVCGQDSCHCRLRGDPIVENCDYNLHFLGTGVFELSGSNDPGCQYVVRISNERHPSGVIVAKWMEITQGGNFIRIDRDHQVSVNGADPVDPPVSLSWVTVTKSGEDYVNAKLTSCDAAFQFWGKNDATRGLVIIPGDIIAQSTGLCNTDPEEK